MSSDRTPTWDERAVPQIPPQCVYAQGRIHWMDVCFMPVIIPLQFGPPHVALEQVLITDQLEVLVSASA